MGNGALQGEHRRKLVGMQREALDLGGGLESHVIVAVHGLGFAAGVHHIELRGDLVAGAEPAFGDEGDDFVGIIFGEKFRIAQAQFFQSVPDAVIGAGLGEMIAAAGLGLVLFPDHGVEGVGGRIKHGLVGEGIPEHENAGAGIDRLGPFRHDGLAMVGILRGLAHRVALIDQNVGLHGAGEGIIAQAGFAGDELDEVIELAAFGGHPGAVGAALGNAVGFHGAGLSMDAPA